MRERRAAFRVVPVIGGGVPGAGERGAEVFFRFGRHALACALEHGFFLCLLLLLQSPLLDEFPEPEPPENVVGRAGILRRAAKFVGRNANRRVPVDRGEIVGLVGALFAVFELCTQRGADVRVVDVLVHACERAVLPHKLERRFLPHARDAGDVVARIAHERLEIDHAGRIEAVFLPEALGRVVDGLGLPHARFDVEHAHMFSHELQSVLIAGDNNALPALLRADAAHGAEKIVRLPAGELAPLNAERVEHVLQNRHLRGEIVRHGLARRLIRLAVLVAERRLAAVEHDAERVRGLVVEQLLQDIQKAENGVRRRAVGRGERAHAVICAVHEAVAVDEHQFWHRVSSLISLASGR